MARCIVRARRKIVAARIPYRIPSDDELGERLREVLAVLYLKFNEGYLASGGDVPTRRDLAEDAAWLTALVARGLSGEPEPLGLLALMRLHLARAEGALHQRRGVGSASGPGPLTLETADDRRRDTLIEQAAALRRPGPYQVEAAIIACHAEAESWAATDWRQIVLRFLPSWLRRARQRAPRVRGW